MENFQKFVVSSVFFLVASVSFLFFMIGYPEVNGYESILSKNPSINNSLNNLTTQFGSYPSEANLEKDVFTSDNPEIGAESIQLVSTVSTTRTQWNRLTNSFKVIYLLVAELLGLSAGSLTILIGVLFSLIAIIVILLVWKSIRTGD